MVVGELIRQILNPRKNRILLFAEAAMPPGQFQAFRRLVLNELGSTGLEGDLVRVLDGRRPMDGQGTGGKIHAGKGVPRG